MSDFNFDASWLILIALLAIPVGIIAKWIFEFYNWIISTYMYKNSEVVMQSLIVHNPDTKFVQPPRMQSTKGFSVAADGSVGHGPGVERLVKTETFSEKNNSPLPEKSLPPISVPIIQEPIDSGAKSRTEGEARSPIGPLKIIDYERHRGIPGFLYVARNNEHRDHLFKLGYTTVSPQHRTTTLDEQLKKAADIGKFRILHSVPVCASRDTEEALFIALRKRRVIGSREYFYADEQSLCLAVDAAAQVCEGSTDALNNFLECDPWSTCPEIPTPVSAGCVIPPRLSEGGGWVILLNNFWHRPDTYRIGFTTKSCREFLHRINSAQRSKTTQIGFYEMVACRYVHKPREAASRLLQASAKYSIGGKSAFVRGSLEVLRLMLETIDPGIPSSKSNSSPECQNSTSGTSASNSLHDADLARLITVHIVHGFADRE